DASGHPTMINYANGRDSRTIDYDADGNPTRVATKDSEWRKEGDKWNEYDANGEKKPVSANSIEVSESGTISIKYESGTEFGIYANGTDGGLTRNKQGHPDEIMYPDGKSREITYDRSEQPKLIKLEDGSVWRKEGQSWKHRDKSGKELERAEHLQVSDEGEISIQKGNAWSTLGRDGHTYGISRDDDYRPTDIAYPNGKPAQHIEYGADGNPTRISSEKGEWRKEGDKWNSYDETGTKVNSATGIEVNDSGDITVKYESGPEVIVYHDGTSSVVVTDAGGRPTHVGYPDGTSSNITYDAGGKPVSIKLSDGSEWKPEGNVWKRHGAGGADLGSASSIEVSPKGDITIRSGNDVSTTVRDGRQFGMQKDEHDRVTSVAYENGRPGYNAKYDADGKLTRVSSGDFEWRKEGNKWTQYDESGQKVDSARDVEVKANGDFVVTRQNGDDIIVDHNGNDGWMKLDKAGHPTEVVYPEGGSNEFKYDRAGHLTSIKGSDGSEWKKEGDGWICRNDKGEQIWSAKNVDVNSRGEIVMTGRGHDDVTVGRDGKNYGFFREYQNTHPH